VETDVADLNHYECIDPQVGGEIWRLDDPATEPALAERLRLHCQYCAACRIVRALDAEIAAGVQEGELTIARPICRSRQGFLWLGGLGATAMAAGLATIMVLPPTAPSSTQITRSGESAPAIERPVSNEVIAGVRPKLKWTPLPGARAYDVSIRSVEGEYAWQERTEDASLQVAREAALPQNQRFRVGVTPIPAHLAPEGGLRSTFRTGTSLETLIYRLTHGSVTAMAAGVVGTLALIVGAVGLTWPRRR